MQEYIKFSFTLTYILLLTTGTITLIEALRTDNPRVRHVMNLETCISIVAGYFYGVFLTQINGNNIDWKKIIRTRYTDWCITTPLMLLALCVVLGMHTKVELHFPTFLLIIALNYTMLYIGYLGETGVLARTTATVLGFVPFFVMFGIIFYVFVKPRYVKANYILYGLYLFVWSLYGIVYLFNEIFQNIALNTLDSIAKCFIGLGLWAYYTKIIQ
jgi:bacteriorhodopsin